MLKNGWQVWGLNQTALDSSSQSGAFDHCACHHEVHNFILIFFQTSLEHPHPSWPQFQLLCNLNSTQNLIPPPNFNLKFFWPLTPTRRGRPSTPWPWYHSKPLHQFASTNLSFNHSASHHDVHSFIPIFLQTSHEHHHSSWPQFQLFCNLNSTHLDPST